MPEGTDWLVVECEAADLIRRIDWAETPLGARENWRSCMRSAVEMVLGCSFPMLTLWGKSLIQIYNDAYADLLAEQHPAAMGRSPREEFRQQDYPIFSRVWAGQTVTLEDVTLPFQQAGVTAEAHFSTCYSPLRNESGVIDGILLTVLDASERVKAEAALRESEERYRTLFDSIDQGFCILRRLPPRADGTHDYLHLVANPGLASHTGIPNAAGHTVLEVAPGFAPYLKLFDRVLLTGQVEHFEVHPPDSEVWIEAEVLPTRKPEQVAAVFTDVSEQRRAQVALQKSEKQFRLFVENVREYALVQTDLNARVTSWNPGAERLFGYASEEIVGKPFDVLFPPEERFTAGERPQPDRVEEHPNLDAHTVRRKDGSEFWAEWVTEALVDDTGAVQGTAKVMRDETERRKTQHRLQESERRLRTILEGIPQLVWRSRDDGDWNWSSPQWQVFTGQTLEASLGLGWLNAVHPDDRALTMQRWHEARGRGKFDVEHRILRAVDRVYVWHHTRSLRSIDSTERTGDWLGTSTDIETSKRAQADKEALLKEVHHRVKNNLQVITSLLNLQAAQIDNEQALAPFDEARNRVASIAVIHELLYRSGSFAAIQLADYVRVFAPDLIRFHGMQERVRLDVTGDEPTLELERAVPFGLMLNELVTNALKHGFPGNRTGRISACFEQRKDGCIDLILHDDGIGIEQGFDADRATSLGLKLVRRLAGQLGGSVRVEPQHGTRVHVRFPKWNAT